MGIWEYHREVGMRCWEKILINNEEFIFFRNSLCLVNNSFDFEKALLMAAEGKEDRVNAYTDIVFDILKQEKMYIDYINSKSSNESKKPKLLGMELNTINACNLKCKYCFAIDGTHNKKSIMTKSLAMESIDFLFSNAANRKTIYITIIGGEPFLNIELFEFIVIYAEQRAYETGKNVRFFTTTNGTILNKDLEEFLDQHPINVLLSFDSQFPDIQNFLRPMKSGIGSWDIIQKNFDYFRKRIRSAVHITLTPFNYKLFEYAKYCYDAGFYCVHFDIVKSKQREFQFTNKQIDEIKNECSKLAEYLVREISNGRNICASPIMDGVWELYNRMPKLNSCEVPFGQCIVGPDGKIYPCDVLMWDQYVLGSIEKKEFNQKFFDDLDNKDICVGCWARYLCGGMCLAEKLQAEDKTQLLYCDYKKHIFKIQLYMYYKLSKSCDYIEKYIKRKMKEYKNEEK